MKLPASGNPRSSKVRYLETPGPCLNYAGPGCLIQSKPTLLLKFPGPIAGGLQLSGTASFLADHLLNSYGVYGRAQILLEARASVDVLMN